MKQWLIVALAYFGFVVFNAGAFYAEEQSHCYSWKTPRRELAESMGFAFAGPLAFPAALFGTGLMEHGWKAPWEFTDLCGPARVVR